MELLMTILTLGLKPLYDKNMSYFKLIRDFRLKLPRPQNQARKITANEIETNPFLPNSLKYVNAIDLSTLQANLSEQDLDLFFNSINHFDYSFMFFKKYYKNYSRNILRLAPKSKNKDFHLAILQELLSDKSKPLKSYEVLIYHLKYEYKLSNKIYKRLYELQIFRKSNK